MSDSNISSIPSLEPPVAPEDSTPITGPEEKLIQEMLMLTKDGFIIKKGMISVRAFLLNDGSTICAFLLSETIDSFVVLMPAKVGIAGDTIVFDKFSGISMVRLFKHHIQVVTIPPMRFLYSYLLGTKPSRGEIPGYFNQERINQADMMIDVMYNADTSLPNPKTVSVKGKDQLIEERTSSARAEIGEPASLLKSKPKRYRH